MISINTSLDGAGIEEDVANFPLLVRLNSGNFDFSSAENGWGDLRFSKSDYTPLPFEIERWDAIAEKAEVWVKMDTVYGNNNTQFIYMYTGNSSSPAIGSRQDVFDTAHGFAGVWHLNENGNTDAGGYKDATLYGYHGTGVNMTADSDVEAAVGKGHRFGGDSSFISFPMPSFINGDPTFSVSFWMDFSMTKERAGILYFGRETTFQGIHFLIMIDTTAQFGPWDRSEIPDGVSDRQNWFSLDDYLEAWSHITLVYDSENSTLTSYINGSQAAVNNLSGLTIDGSGGLHFGKRIAAHESDYKGDLDEIRISNVTRSEAWIKLSYETQKENSTLVRLED
jgi:biopolymer transport protein ExbB